MNIDDQNTQEQQTTMTEERQKELQDLLDQACLSKTYDASYTAKQYANYDNKTNYKFSGAETLVIINGKICKDVVSYTIKESVDVSGNINGTIEIIFALNGEDNYSKNFNSIVFLHENDFGNKSVLELKNLNFLSSIMTNDINQFSLSFNNKKVIYAYSQIIPLCKTNKNKNEFIY